MKTLVSEITGRKDYPVFNQMTNEQIVEYLKRVYWYEHEISFDEWGNIEIDDGEDDRDTFRIIEVEIVDYRQL